MNRPLRTDDLDFELPKGLIATVPSEPRDASRLLVVSRSDPDRIEHRVFSQLPDLLSQRDLLVFNRSRVVPARLLGINEETGGRFEGLFLSEPDPIGPDRVWIAMVRAKRVRSGKRYRLFDATGDTTGVSIELVEPHEPDGPGAWKVRVLGADAPSARILERVGRTPLPPYILAQRKAQEEQPEDADDRVRYQTIYADELASGSIAAPTAGLHFTPRVLDALRARAIDSTHVVLHVGAGTFKPVETETLGAHPMHAEHCALGDAARYFPPPPDRPDRRVVAVGSTSARTLESFARLHEDPARAGQPLPDSLSTSIMIAPGYDWRWVDGMITNFHLPRSTLLAMVASMLEIPGRADGVARIQRIYAEAIREQYRFFSFGDAMLILP